MSTRRFPRRVEIAAAILAAVMTFTFAPRASAQNTTITAHGFTDGFTDIPFTAVGDILQMGYQLPNAPRYLFDHDGPISYNPSSLLLSVQSYAGFDVDTGSSHVIGRTNITAFVDHNGALVNDVAMYSCGGGAPASFCVQASDGTVLLQGQVKGFAYRYNAGHVTDPERQQTYDDFAFYIKLTGGSAAAAYGNYLAVSVHSFTFAWMGPTFNGSFNGPIVAQACQVVGADNAVGHTDCSFGGGIEGVFGMSVQYGMLVEYCNGSISGTAINGLTKVPFAGEQISLTGGDLVNPEVRTTDFNGQYSFTSSVQHATGLCAGTYTVRADLPDGFAPGDLNPTTQSVTFVFDSAGNDVPSVAGSNVVNFAFYPVISTDFKTFGQGAWGAKPHGNNAGALLQTYYIVPYGYMPVVIGNTANNKFVSMSGPLAVQNFLPQGGRPVPLDGPYVDPITQIGQHRPHNRLGSLAGETLALRLNVDFSNASLTKPGLGSLYVASGPLVNCTVNQVLAYGSNALGGATLLSTLTYDSVEDTIERINGNFEGGRSRGYLAAAPVSTTKCKLP